MTELVRIALSDDALDAIAERVAQRLAPTLRGQSTQPEGWMTSGDAATYLGLSRNALHKYTSAREIPFAQDRPGGKLWFKRRDLDAWRDGRR